jgi:hypothetical protein
MSALQAVIKAAFKAAERSALESVTQSKESKQLKVNVSGVFLYNGMPYIKVIPSKRLFNSTMVHEVVTRGDFFAVCMLDYSLTILPTNTNLDKTNGKTK